MMVPLSRPSLASPSPAPALDPARLRAAFEQVRALALEEWPDLDAAALAETGGELELVVALIATHTGHTRAMTRRHLAELVSLALDPEPAPTPAASPPPRARPARPRPAPRARAPRPDDDDDDGPSPVEPLDRLVRSLEVHLDDIARQVKQDVTP
ncbi:hypothetical protein L6R53_31340, partial [Myxococcota bacterium]|nr:hypothetical protein [Myxococcota bacterium]